MDIILQLSRSRQLIENESIVKEFDMETDAANRITFTRDINGELFHLFIYHKNIDTAKVRYVVQSNGYSLMIDLMSSDTTNDHDSRFYAAEYGSIRTAVVSLRDFNRDVEYDTYSEMESILPNFMSYLIGIVSSQSIVAYEIRKQQRKEKQISKEHLERELIERQKKEDELRIYKQQQKDFQKRKREYKKERDLESKRRKEQKAGHNRRVECIEEQVQIQEFPKSATVQIQTWISSSGKRITGPRTTTAHPVSPTTIQRNVPNVSNQTLRNDPKWNRNKKAK